MSPGQRSGPCGDTGRAETLAATKLLDLASDDTRRRRRDALRRALRDAERQQDGPSVALLRAWLQGAA